MVELNFKKINFLGQSSRSHKETLENRQNNEAAQRERYYATIHKVALQNSDKIPGVSLMQLLFILKFLLMIITNFVL